NIVRPGKREWPTTTDLVNSMVTISDDPLTCGNEGWKARNGVFYKLAKTFPKFVTNAHKIALVTMYQHNRDNMKTPPQAQSTPKRRRIDTDRCEYCLGWTEGGGFVAPTLTATHVTIRHVYVKTCSVTTSSSRGYKLLHDSLWIVEMNDNESLFEGCGREGPIRAIFLSEFHHIAGPKIVVQYPSDTISKETFDSLSTYIIPKTHLQRLSMTVNALGKKILGYPIQIRNEKYERNAFYFNVCFVCDAWARTVQYEQVLIKFAEFFHSLELEIEYLSKLSAGHEKELERIFENVIHGLNGFHRESSIVFRDRLLKLKVVLAGVIDPAPVHNHEVPVLISDVYPIEKWDLTTQQIIPYVDGYNHVTKIANLADVDTSLVKTCLQNLLYYRVIKIVPIFLYGNTYCTNSWLHTKLISGDPSFKSECLNFVARVDHTKPHLVDVVRFYCAMRRGVTIKDLCTRFRTMPATSTSRPLLEGIHSSSKYSDISLSSSTQSRTSSNPTTPVKLHSSKHAQNLEFQSILSVVDERRLVLFGLTHGIIRKVEKTLLLQNALKAFRTPYSLNNISDNDHREHLLRHRKKFKALYEMFDGTHTYDEICLAHDLTQAELDEMVERDPDIVIVWK
ncbi:unnamed protein product, partial [Allacma fusca]